MLDGREDVHHDAQRDQRRPDPQGPARVLVGYRPLRGGEVGGPLLPITNQFDADADPGVRVEPRDGDRDAFRRGESQGREVRACRFES